jgi:chorismate synthase
MSFNTFGRIFRFTTWGESHGPALGAVVDGCPPGLPLSEADIQPWLDRRRPGTSRFTTQRREPDAVRILSGTFEGRTTGTSISLMIDNVDHRSKDYSDVARAYRPGHADYAYDAKYGLRDHRGGGRASARETAARVAAGAVARLATVLCEATGVPAGWGAPIYAKLDSELAAACMSINAVKGVEIGDGFAAALSSGEGNADAMRPGADGQPVFLANHAGGIAGGISTGQPVRVRTAFKPTSSILTPVETVTRKGEAAEISTKGRHDPCVGIRGVPVVEAMMALVLADQKLLHRAQCG